MSEQDKAPAVYAAWAGVCEDMARGGVGKSKTAAKEAGGYRFRGIDDVLLALSASMVAHRLAVRAVFTDHVLVEKQKGHSGRCAVEFHLHSLIDGSTVGPFRFLGEASDFGDKATNKIMSIAYKYFAIQTFAIPTEGVLEDEEPNEPEKQVPKQGVRHANLDDFRNIVITAGRDKGKTIGKASDEGLDEWQAIIERAVNNPDAKLSIEDRARAMNTVDAIKREKMSR